MGLGGVIGAAGGYMIGGPLGASIGMQLGSQYEANKANTRLMNDQMGFQRDMANTAYQRAVNDLKKAGLNPMLAYSQGGAPSPQGASATMESVGEGMANTATAMDALRIQNKKTDAEIDKVQSDIEVNEQTKKTLAAQADASASNARQAKANAKILEADVERARRQGEVDAEMVPVDAIINRAYKVMQSVPSIPKTKDVPKAPKRAAPGTYDWKQPDIYMRNGS